MKDYYMSVEQYLRDFPDDTYLRELVKGSVHNRVIKGEEEIDCVVAWIEMGEDEYGDAEYPLRLYGGDNLYEFVLPFDTLAAALLELNQLCFMAPISVDDIEERGFFHE